MKVEALAIEDVKLLTPEKFGDSRGFFSETWQQERYAAVGIPGPFIQDNHVLSTQRGVVRGLHLQNRVIAGLGRLEAARPQVSVSLGLLRLGFAGFDRQTARWSGIEPMRRVWR